MMIYHRVLQVAPIRSYLRLYTVDTLLILLGIRVLIGALVWFLLETQAMPAPAHCRTVIAYVFRVTELNLMKSFDICIENYRRRAWFRCNALVTTERTGLHPVDNEQTKAWKLRRAYSTLPTFLKVYKSMLMEFSTQCTVIARAHHVSPCRRLD